MNEESNLPMRQEFGATQALAPQLETAATAMAAQAKAMVEARYIIAMRNKRNWDQVRQDILHECRRPNFALNKSTYYRKPLGNDTADGLGIRFVETAIRIMTNILVETTMIFEDDDKEVQRVTVTDLESNVTYPLDIRVSKTVERSKPLYDGTHLGVRINSYNKPVYTVPATDDDMLNKRGALISKAIRTLGLRLLPGDIKDEATEIIKQIRLDDVKKDPDAERKRIADAFAELGVKVSDLIAYLGHPLDACSPAELVNLRGIYGAIRDGESTWKSFVENSDAGDEPKPGFQAPRPKNGTNKPNPDDASATAVHAIAHASVTSQATLAKPAAGAATTPAGDGGFEAASPNMKNIVRSELAAARLSEQDLGDQFGFGIDAMPKSQVGAVRNWIAGASNG